MYAKGARNTLRQKIPAVLYFMRLLELSFLAEANYRGTLGQLHADGMVPDFPEIAEQLLAAIGRIDMHFEESAESEKLPNHHKLWTAIKDDPSVRSAVTDYYSEPMPVTL